MTWERPWGQPFRYLLARPRPIPYRDTLFGLGWRMDQTLFLLASKSGAWGCGCTVRPAGYSTERSITVMQRTDALRNDRLPEQLADVNEGGRLCVIPASRKASFPCPEDVKTSQRNRDLADNVPCRAGVMVVFNEAAVHGTLPWTAGHRRRSLLDLYSPNDLRFAGGVYTTGRTEWVREPTPTQRAALDPPHIYNRPLNEEDGVTVIRPTRENPDGNIRERRHGREHQLRRPGWRTSPGRRRPQARCRAARFSLPASPSGQPGERS